MSGIQKPSQGIEKSIEALRSGELSPEEAQRVREELQKISPEHLKELDDFTRSEIQRLISEIDNQ